MCALQLLGRRLYLLLMNQKCWLWYNIIQLLKLGLLSALGCDWQSSSFAWLMPVPFGQSLQAIVIHAGIWGRASRQ
ncbi:MAG TPA: hypothetical protein DDZ80_26720 [Cyanobacteria bacterium UBA8803]|nr:hypothetical protein [Cyanobacteria bacterium UBA9273]HBL61872.1 hypothetical protein [Cyanobacteria bacterium UBA8803]